VLVTSETPDPGAGPGEVVVDVSVADVLFVDAQIRRGWGGEYFTVMPPYVPGNGVAGQVISVAEAADPGWIGRRVVSHTGERGGYGGYAEQAVVPAEGLIPVPDGLGLCEAAALLHDGPTALGLAEGARIRPEEWVLVLAAGGGLGILLVQLAHAAGALVIGAARGKRKLDLARELGADAVVDYSEPAWPGRVREATGGTGPDVVFDGVGGQIGRAAFESTAGGGRFSAHGAPSGAFAEIDPQEAERHGVTVRGIEQVQFCARRREAAGRAGAVRGGGGPNQAGHRADLPVGAGRRRARRDRGPRRHREDPAAHLMAPHEHARRSPTTARGRSAQPFVEVGGGCQCRRTRKA
jgi:NADPH2:quinone reductase